jgi:hypothetical protein
MSQIIYKICGFGIRILNFTILRFGSHFNAYNVDVGLLHCAMCYTSVILLLIILLKELSKCEERQFFPYTLHYLSR